MTDAMAHRALWAVISLLCFGAAGSVVWFWHRMRGFERRMRELAERQAIAEFTRKRRVVQEHFLRIEDGPEEQRDTIPDKAPMGFRGA